MRGTGEVRMGECREPVLCMYCEEFIEPKEEHIIVGETIHFHFTCWEKKKIELRKRYFLL